jgi:hypothetical protein
MPVLGGNKVMVGQGMDILARGRRVSISIETVGIVMLGTLEAKSPRAAKGHVSCLGVLDGWLCLFQR